MYDGYFCSQRLLGEAETKILGPRPGEWNMSVAVNTDVYSNSVESMMGDLETELANST